MSKSCFFCKTNVLFNLIIFMIFSNRCLFAGWHDRKAEGWAWYEDRKAEEEAKVQQNEESTNPTAQLDQVRKNLEEKLATALLDPTPGNIRSYMEEQQKWMERSSHFAQTWAQVLLNYPQLDYTATHLPVSQYGLQTYKKNLQDEKEALIGSLAKDYGLFFFYEGKNEGSNMFGQIVKELSKKYKFEVIAISLDDVEIDGFSSNKKNNGIARTLGVDIAPALYLINPKTNVAVPIAYGFVAMDKMEDNIALQINELKDNNE